MALELGKIGICCVQLHELYRIFKCFSVTQLFWFFLRLVCCTTLLSYFSHCLYSRLHHFIRFSLCLLSMLRKLYVCVPQRWRFRDVDPSWCNNLVVLSCRRIWKLGPYWNFHLLLIEFSCDIWILIYSDFKNSSK